MRMPAFVSHRMDVFEHYREVAHVVAELDVVAEDRFGVGPRKAVVIHQVFAGTGQQFTGKKVNGVLRSVEQAVGFGFNVQVDEFARFAPDIGEGGHGAGQVFARGAEHGFPLVGLPPGAVRDGGGGDAARHPVGHQLREDGRQPHRVRLPVVGGPVGPVHVVLHPLPVEAAEREAVEDCHVEAVPVEPGLQVAPPLGVGQRSAGRVGEAQPDAHRRPGRHFVFEGQRVLLKTRKHVVPAFARVNVGAVRQVQGIAGFHGAKNKKPSAVHKRKVAYKRCLSRQIFYKCLRASML
jgi:hypothetical protein